MVLHTEGRRQEAGDKHFADLEVKKVMIISLKTGWFCVTKALKLNHFVGNENNNSVYVYKVGVSKRMCILKRAD